MGHRTTKDLHEFILDRVRDAANSSGMELYRAFPRWFAQMYFQRPEGMVSSDGPQDGKIDLFFHTVSGNDVTYHVINSKFTEAYNQAAPVGFYDEVLSFYDLFERPQGRGKFIQQKVKAELRPQYKKLFEAHEAGRAKLLFLTNCRRNDGQYAKVEQLDVTTFHFEDLVQHVLDDLDGAMPRTPDLVFQQISTTLSPPREETGVSTTIVFARLVDFVDYMETDQFDLLFARNVRIYQGNNIVNRAVAHTFVDHPEEFAYSNNGITVLCEQARHEQATRELRLVNPRVVNGSQTLHSVQSASNSEGKGLSAGARHARVMVRVVCVPPPARGADAPEKAAETKEIINRISIRSNQQNPIKPWNLRANDDFQMEIARRFRKDDFFYERRDREWKLRSVQLRNVGVAKGPSIKPLMARLACYHWKNPKLGPVQAKGHVGEIFDGDAYDVIRRETTPELAYQVYAVSTNVLDALRSLSARKYSNARAHVDLATFSIVCRALTAEGAAWRKDDFTAYLQRQWADWEDWEKAWVALARAAADLVLERFEKAARLAQRREGEDLTLKNFVRRKEDIHALLSGPVPGKLRKAAKQVLPDS